MSRVIVDLAHYRIRHIVWLCRELNAANQAIYVYICLSTPSNAADRCRSQTSCGI
ncbi:hypothetical protein Plhal710r2_c064g0173701 [Plasmopara halstedii]